MPRPKGSKHSIETRIKMSETHKNKWSNGDYNNHKGLKALIKYNKSKEGRKNMSDRMKGKQWQLGREGLSGKDCPNWKGGFSSIEKLCRRMREYKDWRTKVYERDKWTCQTCQSRGIYLTAHHIEGFSKILRIKDIKDIKQARKCDELWDIDNGVTLCEYCHSLTDNYKGKCNKNKKKYKLAMKT